jgi:nucleotide-binding universal stress UspA family protein
VYARVLVAYDGSLRSRTALPTAELAAGAFGCPVQLVHIPAAEDPPAFPQETGVLVVNADAPATGLIEQVRATDPLGLLWMSTRGRGPIGELVFGSVAAQVVRNLQAPLLVVGPNVPSALATAWRRMLVCLDGSDTAAAIVPVVRDWALALRLQVHLLHIAYPLGDPRQGELRIPEEEQAGLIVTAVVRHDAVIVPSGNTRIRADDVLLITAQRDRAALERLTAWARGEQRKN